MYVFESTLKKVSKFGTDKRIYTYTHILTDRFYLFNNSTDIFSYSEYPRKKKLYKPVNYKCIAFDVNLQLFLVRFVLFQRPPL